MGFRFQKRIRLLPGLTLNVSKRGVSTSLGMRGARVTFGRGKTRTTLGVPGTGLSYTSVQSHRSRVRAASVEAPSRSPVRSLLHAVGLCLLFVFMALLFLPLVLSFLH